MSTSTEALLCAFGASSFRPKTYLVFLMGACQDRRIIKTSLDAAKTLCQLSSPGKPASAAFSWECSITLSNVLLVYRNVAALPDLFTRGGSDPLRSKQLR